MGKLIRTAAIVLTVGLAGACSSAAANSPAKPPGWVAHPTGATNPANWVCFGAACYHVDGAGHPYGQPFTQQTQ